MALLLRLAERPGEVVGIEELLARGWPDVIVSPDSVYQAITSLRRQLGDDSRQPRYIATVPRLGYRLIAEVTEAVELAAPGQPSREQRPQAAATPALPPVRPATVRPGAGVRARALGLLGIVLLVAVGVAGYRLANRGAAASAPPVATPTAATVRTLAVLPFLDLTDAMTEEPFADGMTEELIVRLSRVPGLRVSAPTASFHFKDKQPAVADIAGSLGVSYLLDGSVRKSGRTLRISARLLRADDGFVVWSGSYDRPHEDTLKVQDEIAGEVAAALARLAPSAETSAH